ncbi:MAG: PAS domain-containing protein [Alphaproteobacteria bacterium]|nr:PAS domain-containing protein [Alphaproteobacteria bacterium]
MWVSGEARGSQEDLILHPGARLLLDTWLTLKGERAAPSRSDLDLRQMHRQAPWLFILEPVQGARTFTYRLAGTGLCGFLKQDMTGCDFLAGWERFRLRYLTDLEQRIGADMLALPMTARDGETVHVLGGLFPHGNPDIWSYERLAPADLAAVRLFGNKPEKIGVRPDVQAPRKFRLISGGLDLS